ncbi:MAG: hypothetical protein JXA52_10185 [Planctomycetes bacterium]|nr:hypothetical protein [Planctomycetota bacterium]
MPSPYFPLNYFTLEVYEEFLTDLTRLQAWYLWWLTQKEKLPFDEAVAKRIYLFPRVYRSSDKDWAGLEAESKRRYAAQGDNPDTHELEEWLLSESLAAIKAHAPELYQIQWVNAFKVSLGGFSYNYRTQGEEELAYLHFRNIFIPDSPFAHREEMKAGLTATIQKISEEKPNLQRILMGTWLNDVEAFASLFPSTWLEGAIYEAPANHMGWWGQFMNKAGRLHGRTAQQFRATGKFPFRNIMCECTMVEFKQHVGLA